MIASVWNITAYVTKSKERKGGRVVSWACQRPLGDRKTEKSARKSKNARK